MEVKKKDLVIAFSVVYLFLVMIQLYVGKKSSVETPCDGADKEFHKCLRFCCKNSTFCNEKIIRSTIKDSEFFKIFNEKSFSILYGKPTCLSLKPLTEEELWGFTGVSFVCTGSWVIIIWNSTQIGDEFMKEKQESLFYSHDHYCLEETTTESSVSWTPLVCQRKLVQHEVIIFSCEYHRLC